jgi:N6-adenosine-specific RNA methylase IME4
MTALVRYEAARAALAEASSVDEVKDVRDIAVAMQCYARQAKDHDLIDQATEIRLRAERRLGEMIIAQKKTVGLAKGGQPYQTKSTGSSEEPVAPTLASAGIDKKLSARAQKIAAIPESKFETYLAAAKKQAADALRMTAAEKQQRRTDREAELGAKQLAWPTKISGVIYVDVPWSWASYSQITGMDRAPSYPTMDLDAIKALDIASIAAPDCVLFMWATVPTLMQAGEVMAAWGFEYKSHIVWLKKDRGGEKDRGGTGYWNRCVHEILLIGTRGKIPAPAQGTQEDSVIAASIGEHSAKPAAFAEMIERLYPTLPKIELFARGAPRPRWDVWGNEAEQPT